MANILLPYVQRLQAAGIESPWKEARKLAAFALGRPYEELLLDPPQALSSKAQITLEAAIERRARHEPLTKILGQASFWRHHFLTTADTLDPRPESELFIETILRDFPDHQAPLSFLDLGTGTGCLLLSCLIEYPNASGTGADISPEALAIAQANAKQLNVSRVTFQQSCWNQAIQEQFDIVLSNPPYIRQDADLEADVLFDPALALFGGEDGLQAYREIFQNITSSLKPTSRIYLEIGRGQRDAVIALARRAGLQLIEARVDLQDIPRLLIFRPQP